MIFFKNIHFTRIIRAMNRLREFNFRKRTPAQYDCDVCNEQGERFFFKLLKIGERWKIDGLNLPSWITTSEESICHAIEGEGIA